MSHKPFIAIFIVFCIFSVFAVASEAKKVNAEKFYIFHSLAESRQTSGSITFYAEEMSENNVKKKAKLWIAIKQERKSLAVICPEPQSDDDPDAYLRWCEELAKRSKKLNKLFDQFYSINGKVRKITISGDEQSLLCIINARFGMPLFSYIVAEELIGVPINNIQITHCNFERFQTYKMSR